MPLNTLKLSAMLLALATGFSSAAQTLRAADVHNSDDYPTVAAVRHMGELLSQRSGGRLKIKVFNKGALGSEKETIDQAKVGALDLARVNISPMNAICAKTLVPTMPFLFRSIEHMRRALDSAAGEEILRSCEPQGFVGLAFYDSGARSIYGRKPVKSVADARGMKIRVPQSDLWVALISAMGANATPMPIGEVYTGLKTGLIDAAENNVPSFEGFKHFEAVKFYSRTEHSMAPEMLLMSKRSYDKLSAADQALVRAAAKESVAFQRQKWDEQEAKSLAVVFQKMVGGMQVFSFLAIPFFVFAGELMLHGGIAERIVKFANSLVGHVRGGLGMSNVLGCTLFGGVAGSPLADVSAMGSVMIPLMKKEGYHADYAVNVTTHAALVGALMPTSHNLIIFVLASAGIASVSVFKLILAALIPALILTLANLAAAYGVAVKRGYPVHGPFPGWPAVLKAFGGALPGLLVVLIILVGILSGVFTATESAATAVCWALAVTALVYR